MISAILMDCDKDELQLMSHAVRNIIAAHSDEDSRICLCRDLKELRLAMRQNDLEDFSCLDVTCEGGLSAARKMREKYPQCGILLIVNRTLSPMQYIRPGIMASSIILRPSAESEIRAALEEFVLSCIRPVGKEEEECLRIETRDGVTRIPYARICYFEASRKKIFVRMRKEEYSYYDTLDSLAGELPGYFSRCHRSYIVNMNMITRYAGTDGLLILNNGLTVPVSRSYRSAMREGMR